MVHQPSDKGGCHLLIVQYVDPSGEFQICIQDDDFLLMDLGKVVKQQLGSCPVIGSSDRAGILTPGEEVHEKLMPCEQTKPQGVVVPIT